jgi:hypothetical protein
MISGKGNRIEEVDIHHILEAVGVGVVDSHHVGVDWQEVQDMASTVDVEVVEPRTKDSQRVEGMLRGKAEEHASTVKEVGTGMAGDAGTWAIDIQIEAGQSTAVKEQGVHHTSKVEQVG